VLAANRLKTLVRCVNERPCSVPGQAKGNGLNLSGGVWHEITVSGAAAPTPSGSASAGGGGYAY
jgi:hypothetical protein